MMKVSWLSILCATLIGRSAFACGGGVMTREALLQSALVAQVRSELELLSGKRLEITEIFRGGDLVFDIDKKAHASTMCGANFTFIYFRSPLDTANICIFGFDISAEGIEVEQMGFAGCRIKSDSANLKTIDLTPTLR